MPLHSLEFTLSEKDEARVREDWEALAAVGPSQAHHRGATNAPHVTLCAAPSISPGQAVVADSFAPLLPAQVRVAGLVVLGQGPFTVAWLLAPEKAIAHAAERCRREIGDVFAGAWLPHITLARRVPPSGVAPAMEVMAARPLESVALVGLRRWDPDTKTVHPVAGATPSQPGVEEEGT